MKKFMAVLGLLAAAQEGQTWAATFDVTNGQTLTAAQTLAAGQTGTIETGGKLSVTGTAVAVSVTGNTTIQNYGMLLQTGTGRAIRDNTGGLTLTLTNHAGALIQTADADVIQMNKANSNVTVYNYGTMTSLNASAGGSQAIDFNAITTGSNSVYNYATGVLQANEADAVRPGVNGFVYNDGLIKATNNPGSTDGSDGIDAQTNSGITVVNATTGTATVAGTGTIEGARHGITGGNTDVTTSGAYVLNVTNNLGGTIQGDNGSGINIDGFNANEVVTVVKHGTITGNGVSSDGDGVDVDGLVNITNTGTIQSLHAYDDTSEGVTVGGGSIVNSGTITGLNSATNADGTANTGVGRGITLAGVDKDPTTGLPIPIEGIYANTSVTNSGLIRGQSDSGIAVTGAANAFTVDITNLAGGTIEGGGATAAAIATAGNNATVINYGTITADSSNLAVDLGSGDSSLQILGGVASVNGNISGGSGSSALTIAPGAGNGFSYAGDITNFSSVAIGAGTVTLSGNNTYTGATTVSGGTLSVAADANLGDTSSTLTLDGGTLQITGAAFNSTARSIALGSAGGAFDIADAGNTFTLAQALGGAGALTKLGAGTLVLSGANTYSGGTTISAGTLQGDSSSLQGSIADNATLTFDQSTDGVFAGVVSGTGALDKSGAGSLTLTGANSYTGGTTISAGTLQGDTGSLQGNITDNAALIFDQANDGTFADAISGTGTFTKTGAGTLTLNGASSATGASEIQDGTMLVGGDSAHANASIGGDVTVEGNSTLGGFGTIGGNVMVQTDGHLSPGNGAAVGTLSINGNLSLAQNSQLDFSFGTPGTNFQTFGAGDSVKVGGNLSLNGSVLNISDAGGFGPGLYNLFSYAGTLTQTNGGITLGSTPSGNFAIQNLTGDKQINLLNTTGATLNFWNANGLASATQAGGGSGTWTTTSLNWTDATGSVTSAMQPQPGFAIFSGAPGTVTVSNGTGAVSATGMQFASSGYILTGDTLTLVGSNGAAPIIRVGDGSSAGSADTATINNVVAGSDGLDKADLGMLVLTGNNTYSGGTTISGGTLSVSSDANLGSAGSALTLDGGTLQVTGTGFTGSTRAITLGNAGGGFDIADAGNSFIVTQALGGAGALTKLGAGTLVLSGANTYSGGTTINAGTLQGDSTSLQGNIVDNAALAFDQSSDGAYAGVVSGSGTFAKTGNGTLTLGGANTYTGGTTISAGTLQGNSTSLQGAIVDSAALVFDQDTDGTYSGVVSGSGTLAKTGNGALTLGGANSYTAAPRSAPAPCKAIPRACRAASPTTPRWFSTRTATARLPVPSPVPAR
jgi:autotransporter-associated beta strand protein